MLAIDTNVVVRYLANDHPAQSPKARTLVDSDDVFVSITVMLESEWVLRSVYGYSPNEVCVALRAFAGLERVTTESHALVAKALDRAERGMDFADALHLGSAEKCEALVTFDRDFVKAARTAGVEDVRQL
jgi:predicted nucleic acid-binding protein